ncbi:uncharacterized protein EDB93DRAFT_1137063 [Suillus bovinus]|uniref:uncharacterized protein n=1 Tax=Suillus bovinus TaxID=48563 RepID=UPI001B869121|nr:uncharacterized protein EDB93DRAFT_1137063 [Suillus bovinus]KAG2152560.1 hypothetical protein EDB93DRAFT_1137063 [Suillus bovinus]
MNKSYAFAQAHVAILPALVDVVLQQVMQSGRCSAGIGGHLSARHREPLTSQITYYGPGRGLKCSVRISNVRCIL